MGDTAPISEENAAQTLHPAEHRAYRELHLAARQLLSRWRRLAAALADTDVGPALENGSLRVREMLGALEQQTARYGLYGRPAAQGIGARVGGARAAVVDRSVDSGMAARLAVLDIEHVTTLLGHLAEIAAARGDRDLWRFCRDWEKRLRPEVDSIRKAAVALGEDPDRAAQPLDSSPLGRAAHGAGWVFGTIGEWFDRRVGRRTSGGSTDAD